MKNRTEFAALRLLLGCLVLLGIAHADPLADETGTLPDGALARVRCRTEFYVLMPGSKILWTDWQHPSSWRPCFDGSKRVRKIFRVAGNEHDLYRQDEDGSIFRSSLEWEHEMSIKWTDVNASHADNPQRQLEADEERETWYSLRADGQIWVLTGTGVDAFVPLYVPKKGLFGGKRPTPERIWVGDHRLFRLDTDHRIFSYFGNWGWQAGAGPEHQNG